MATGNEKKFELKIGKTGISAVVVGMTALLCVAFLFGINVGQNMDTYPEKIASIPQRLLALVWRPAKIKLAQQNASGGTGINSPSSGIQDSGTTPAGENIDLTYHQTLTSKKGTEKEGSFVEEKPVVDTPAIGEEHQKGKFHIETRTENTDPNKFLSQNQLSTQMEDVKKPVKQKEISKTNSKIQTPSASKNAGQNESEKMKDPLKEKETVTQQDTKQTKAGDQDKQPVKQKFIIQVASLKDKSTANKMNKEIASMGFQPKIIKTEIKGKGIVYRVVVSDIKNKEHAQKAANKISAKTKSNCMIKKIEIKTKEN